MRRGGDLRLPAVLALAAGMLCAGGPDADEVVRRLQKRYDTTRDFVAAFTQEVELVSLGRTLRSEGTVYYKKPGKMRWEFTNPERQLLVADGRYLWQYQPEDHQVVKTRVAEAFSSHTPVSFLTGVGRIAEHFTAEVIGPCEEGTVRLRLRPRSEGGLGVLVLTVDESVYDIRTAEVIDPLGNATRFRFRDVRRDVGSADELFTFTVPPGTDVIVPPGEGGPAGR